METSNKEINCTSPKMQSLPEWYGGKHIFITGATGFMGKILVEKLLRCCPNLAAIYMLVRPKRNRTPSQRLEDFINQPIFDLVRDSPNGQAQFEKLHCVWGDVTKENLGVSMEDSQKLEDNVQIVFHMAANVRFDQPLKQALLMNTGGTLNLLEAAKSFKKLMAFVHVSTTYCHCDETILEERLYKAPHNPRKILEMASWLEDSLLEKLSPDLLQNAPNTYAYTKCLTEQLITEYSSQLPIAIARPSIVIAAYKEPIPGWVDNLNGPTGLMVGAGKGVIRTMHCNPDLKADIVPVDIAINDLLVIARELANSSKLNEPMVIHLTNGKDNPISWGEALELGKKHFFDNPFSICLWYPGGSIKSNYMYHMFCVVLFHYIPAYLIDFLLGILGQKKFLVNTQNRVATGLKVLQYYTTRPWYFHNNKIKKMTASLSDADQKMFYTDLCEIDWNKYMLDYVKGARKYCVREEPETIPKAKKTMRKLFIIHVIVKAIFVVFFALLAFRVLRWTGMFSAVAVPAV